MTARERERERLTYHYGLTLDPAHPNRDTALSDLKQPLPYAKHSLSKPGHSYFHLCPIVAPSCPALDASVLGSLGLWVSGFLGLCVPGSLGMLHAKRAQQGPVPAAYIVYYQQHLNDMKAIFRG